MFRISGHFLYQVGANLSPLTNLGEQHSRSQARTILYSAQTWLDAMLDAHELFRLRACWSQGNELRKRIRESIAEINQKVEEEKASSPPVDAAEAWNKKLDFLTAFLVRHDANQFETLLAAELSVADLYAITKKRGFDTTALAERGAEIFPADLITKVTEATYDAAQAGRCLAFELPNAAAFHLYRILELVLRRYYDKVTNNKARPEKRNIGAYIDAMKGAGFKDQKVFSALAGLKNFHRNPVMHPDEALETIDDAIALFGAINSVIIYMLKALPPEPLTLTPPPSEHDKKAIEDKSQEAPDGSG
jgi:hypothetical protein